MTKKRCHDIRQWQPASVSKRNDLQWQFSKLNWNRKSKTDVSSVQWQVAKKGSKDLSVAEKKRIPYFRIFIDNWEDGRSSFRRNSAAETGSFLANLMSSRAADCSVISLTVDYSRRWQVSGAATRMTVCQVNTTNDKVIYAPDIHSNQHGFCICEMEWNKWPQQAPFASVGLDFSVRRISVIMLPVRENEMFSI